MSCVLEVEGGNLGSESYLWSKSILQNIICLPLGADWDGVACRGLLTGAAHCEFKPRLPALLLSVSFQVEQKVFVLTYKALKGLGPDYLLYHLSHSAILQRHTS